ncbi:MAG: hypothetical protein PHH01_01080 [Patescibacteria group bacterium]|nr:hypothetical protein [Patescibacteria group bacterium]
MSYQRKTLKLSEVLLYRENPRLENSFSEEEAIQKIIYDQQDKLVRLAEHIIDNGFNPTDIPIAITKSGKYYVKEGNRRIASLKLVNNPNLVFSNEALKHKFLLLKSQKGHLVPETVEFVVFDKPGEADEWIRLKHAVKHQGVGIERWNSQQANRFAKGDIEDYPLDLQAIEILKHNKQSSSATKELIPSLKTTNLRRLLSDPYVRSKIGLELSNKKLTLLKPKNKSLKNLEKIVNIISKPTFFVDKIYHSRDRKGFIGSVKLNKIQLHKVHLIKSTKKQINDRNSDKYFSLIDPRSNPPKKTSPKLRKIYGELQKISVDIAPHATAFLLRALIEISVKNFLKKKNITIDKDGYATVNLSTGTTIKLDSLKKKINHIATTYVTDNDLKTSIQLLNKSSFTTTLNQFVHNDLHQSTSTSVRDFWINAENLLIYLLS